MGKGKKMKMNLKKYVNSAVVTACLVCAAAMPLKADMSVSMTTYGSYRQGLGGEFTFYLEQGFAPDYLDQYDQKAKPAGNAIQTFCLEETEYIYQYKTYDVTISNSAKNGGKNYADNAVPGLDNISSGSAWLYEQFAAGTLTGYNYSVATSDDINDRKYSGQLLQNAIWALEDEMSMPTGNVFIDLLTSSGQFASIADAKNDYLGNKVAVMNLTLNGSRIQDQIVLNPTPVPVPGALALAGIGTFIVGIRKRKAIS